MTYCAASPAGRLWSEAVSLWRDRSPRPRRNAAGPIARGRRGRLRNALRQAKTKFGWAEATIWLCSSARMRARMSFRRCRTGRSRGRRQSKLSEAISVRPSCLATSRTRSDAMVLEICSTISGRKRVSPSGGTPLNSCS